MSSSEQGGGRAGQVLVSLLRHRLTFPQSLPKLENFSKESKPLLRYLKEGAKMSSLQRSPKTPGLWSDVCKGGQGRALGEQTCWPLLILGRASQPWEPSARERAGMRSRPERSQGESRGLPRGHCTDPPPTACRPPSGPTRAEGRRCDQGRRQRRLLLSAHLVFVLLAGK